MKDSVLTSPGEARLYLDADMPAAEILRVAGGAAAVVSTRQPGKETPNEDAAAVIPCGEDTVILVVADGLGGVAAGERAARIAVDAIRALVSEAAAAGTMLRTAIINAIELANRQVLDLEVGAGTTLAVVEIQETEVRPYHVGDSMILVVGQRGRVKLQTVSHSPIGYAVESGLLDEHEAMHHEDRHLVSNVIGSPQMRIELGATRRLAARDTVLLSSDGLIDNLHTAEFVELARKGSLEEAAANLLTQARARMTHPVEGTPSKPDDLTFVIFRRR